MEKPSKILYHIDILKTICGWSKPTKGTMHRNGSLLDGVEAELSPHKKAFEINFEDHYRSGQRLGVGQKHKKIGFAVAGTELVFEYVWLLHYSPPYLRGDVDFFYTKGYSKKRDYYYRLVFPLKEKFDFHYQVDQVAYTSDLLEWSRSATKAVIDGNEFIAYTFTNKNRDEHFFAIESEIKMNYDTFSDKAFSLKNALGYLTGYLVGDGGYFFAYIKKEMKEISKYYYCSFRDTIKSSYSPIHTNPYSLLHDKNTIAERLYKKRILRTVNFDELSDLTNKLYRSLELTAAIILLLESSVASLLFMPGGYAIVMEALSDIIVGNEKLKLSPIKDKPKARLLREQLLKVLDNECTNLPPNDLAVLKTRIEQINQVTNGERLKAPFTKLGITLLEGDMEILRSRNDFLHGRIPDISKTVANPGEEEKNRDLYYASQRFYTLLSILILKWIGFDNYVINYPKLNQDYCKIKLKEQYFRKL